MEGRRGADETVEPHFVDKFLEEWQTGMIREEGTGRQGAAGP